MVKRRFAALTFSISLLGLAPFASGGNAFGGQWPPLPEGVQAEREQVWGALANGLRYAIVPTDSASEAVSLRLMVAAGRAQDEKGKAGVSELLADLSHFGTREVGRDALVQFKLANGMDPHARSFAMVDLNHTLYRFDLEEPASGAVERSLDLLGGFASAPRFDAAAFGSAKSRLEHLSGLGLGLLEPKQAVTERALLRSSDHAGKGDAEISAAIAGIELGDVESYWSKWYQANRMVLVVTGVVDPAAVEAAIVSAFSGLEASEEARPLPRREGKFRSAGDLAVEDSPSSAAAFWITSVSRVGSLFDRAAEVDYYTLDLIGRIAQSYATGSDRLPRSVLEVYGDHAALSVHRRGAVGTLLEQLLAADRSVHLLAEHGVRAEDLKRAKEDYLNLRYSYDMEVSGKEWAPLVADRLIRSVTEQVPFRYGSALSDFVQEVVAGIRISTVQERSAQLFREKELSYYLELPDGFPLGAKAVSKRLKAMRKGYDFTWEQAGEVDQDWNLDGGFESGGMVESTSIIRFEEYPVLKYEFVNNLRMNLIRSDAFKGRVQVMVSFGNGISGLENANLAFGALVRSLMLETKVGRGVQARTMEKALESKGIEELDAGVTKDHLYWSGVGRDAEDVEAFLSAVLAWMVAGNVSEEDYDDQIERLGRVVERSMDPSSTVQLDRMLHEADERLQRFYGQEDVDALEFAGVRQWLRAVREEAYIEITVVGDVEPRTVLRDVRKTFGSAPARTGKVMQPRHGGAARWSEPGVKRDTFEMQGKMGNLTLLFPQVAEKSCANDRMHLVFLPLFEEHLRRALAEHPVWVSNLSVETFGHEMIPLSNAIQVQLFCSSEEAEAAEALLLESAESFEASLTEPYLRAAERNALLGLKRIARSQSALVEVFDQSQGRPNTLGCVLDLLDDGFGVSFDEYKEVASEQFSKDNVRGVSLMPAE